MTRNPANSNSGPNGAHVVASVHSVGVCVNPTHTVPPRIFHVFIFEAKFSKRGTKNQGIRFWFQGTDFFSNTSIQWGEAVHPKGTPTS